MGREIARVFGSRGYSLALLARNTSTLEPIARETRDAGSPEVRTYTMDVVDQGSVRTAFGLVRDELGDPAILVYNVATMVKTPPSELTVQEVIDTLPEIFFGAIHCTAEVLPAMRDAGRGTLLYTGGGFGIKPAVFTASHSVGKAALRNYVQNLHQELSPEGILAATVTITRPVQAGTEYDGSTIAAHYLALHEQTTHRPTDEWEWEIIHREL